MPRRMTRAGALAVLGLLVAACALGGPTTHSLILAGEEPGVDALAVTVFDESGHVRDVTQQIGWPPGAAPPPDAVTWNPPDAPNRVRLQWTGGACDIGANLTVRARGNGFGISLTTVVEDVPCDGIGIARSVVLTFDRPVAAALVTLDG